MISVDRPGGDYRLRRHDCLHVLRVDYRSGRQCAEGGCRCNMASAQHNAAKQVCMWVVTVSLPLRLVGRDRPGCHKNMSFARPNQYRIMSAAACRQVLQTGPRLPAANLYKISCKPSLKFGSNSKRYKQIRTWCDVLKASIHSVWCLGSH